MSPGVRRVSVNLEFVFEGTALPDPKGMSPEDWRVLQRGLIHSIRRVLHAQLKLPVLHAGEVSVVEVRATRPVATN